MDRWRIRSRIYKWFRRVFPINLIYEEEMDNLIDLLERIPNQLYQNLDLGTGIGESLQYVPPCEHQILYDSSQSMLHRAPSMSKTYKVVGEMMELPFKPHQFDLVTCIGTSEYILPKAQLLEEVYSVLKPGAHAVITFSPKNMFSRLRNLLGKRVHPLSGSTAHDLISAQGFYIVCAKRSAMQSQYLLQKL